VVSPNHETAFSTPILAALAGSSGHESIVPAVSITRYAAGFPDKNTIKRKPTATEANPCKAVDPSFFNGPTPPKSLWIAQRTP
jgi:hypothetical protein